MACPCALVISTPVVVTCGIAQAARLGLLVKGGTYLEILGRLKVVALDKTGTLSEGQFCVSNLLSTDGISTVHQVLYWYDLSIARLILRLISREECFFSGFGHQIWLLHVV